MIYPPGKGIKITKLEVSASGDGHMPEGCRVYTGWRRAVGMMMRALEARTKYGDNLPYQQY